MSEMVDFGIWANLLPGKRPAYRKWMAKEHCIAEMLAHQLFVRDTQEGQLVQIFSGYGWLELPGLVAKLPDFVDASTAKLAMSDLKPDGNTDFCQTHQVFYWRWCPVCDGNIYSRGRRMQNWAGG